MKESIVRRHVLEYFQTNKYFTVPRLIDDKVEKKFKVGDGGAIEPDVVAFKWLSGYEIECLAVECKGGRAPQAIYSALEQATTYQKFFPKVYIASEKSPSHPEVVEGIKKVTRVGYLPVTEHGVDDKGVIPPDISLRLDYRLFDLQVRARGTLLLIFDELFDGKFIFSTDNPGFIWCDDGSIIGLVTHNYGYYYDEDFYSGINIERKGNVEKTILHTSSTDLFHHLKNLPDNYHLSFGVVKTYRPREVSWNIIYKSSDDIQMEDVEKLIEVARNENGKIHFQVCRRVWRKGEILNKRQYTQRITGVIDETKDLKKVLTH